MDIVGKNIEIISIIGFIWLVELVFIIEKKATYYEKFNRITYLVARGDITGSFWFNDLFNN